MPNDQIIAEEPPVVDKEVSLRETIAEAFDKTNEQATREDPAGKPVAEPVGQPPAEEGKAEGQVREGEQPKPVTDGDKGARPAAAEATPPAAGQPQELKAPSQWKPAIREKWGQLPREVQEEVLRREADSLRLIGSVGPKIRLADEVNQFLQPFNDRLQERGVQTKEFLGDVFTTIGTLASGDPVSKAQVVANIVQSYGVDLAVLDQVLARRYSAPPPSPELIEARRKAEMYERQIRSQDVQRDEQLRGAAQNMLDTFAADPKNEFFNDVRPLMAELMSTGQAKSLEEAYSAAIWATPDTRKILLQREAEARIQARSNRAGAARIASSSVGGSPRVPGGVQGLGNQSLSLRDTIAAAIDEHSQP